MWFPLAAASAVEPASTWEVGELRPVMLGPALATSAAWDGAPAWFVGGPDGLRVLTTDGERLLRTEALHPVALVVRQLDGTGDPDIVACGPEGIALVRGSRQGLGVPRSLSEVPCGSLVAYDLERYPGLASISEGELVTWVPTGQGLEPTHTGIHARSPYALASSGGRVAVVGTDGALHLTNPTETVAGPIAGVDATRTAFVWAGAGEGATWSGGGVVGPGITGVVADPRGGAWFVDGPGKRLRHTSGFGECADCHNTWTW